MEENKISDENTENNINSDKTELLKSREEILAEKQKDIEPMEVIKESSITELKVAKPKMQEFIEFIRDLIVIIFIVIVIRTYIVAPFQISWSSMETSYHDKEFLLVNKLSYANEFGLFIWNPSRGDVVIFKPHASNNKEFYIKRVIGLAWDTIKFEDWEVYVKKSWDKTFIKLNEDYLSAANKWKTFLPFDVKETEFSVPKWDYFLMWDNRNNSSDSRSCFMSCSIANSSHFIKRTDIIGRVLIDFWYFNIFKINEFSWAIEWIGKIKWSVAPRFFNTPKTWDYKELK